MGGVNREQEFIDAWRKISGHEGKIEFNESYGVIGKGAVKGGIYDDIFWKAVLVRGYTGPQRAAHHEGKLSYTDAVPDGDLSTLSLLTRTPKDAEPLGSEKVKTKVITKIEYPEQNLQKRIEDAIKTHKITKAVLCENINKIVRYVGALPVKRSLSIDVFGSGLNLTVNNKEEPLVSLIKALGSSYSDLDMFKASAEPKSLPELIPQIDFHLEKFEKVIR